MNDRLPGAGATPALRRYPDARRGSLPLMEPSLLPYYALLFGSGVAAIVAAYDALVMRRVRPAIVSLLLGIAGWFGFLVVVGNGAQAHVKIGLVILAGRIVHVLIGALLYFLMRPYVRGHRFLGGRMLPLRMSYLAAFVAAMLMPGWLMLTLLGIPGVPHDG